MTLFLKTEISENEKIPAKAKIEDDRFSIKESDTILLVIDDDLPFVQNYMVETIHRFKAKILIALTGAEGLSLMKKFTPQGIFLDIMLPDMDGYEILREIKSARELKNIPIQIISAKQEDNRFDHTGVFGYLTKPLNAEHFEDVIAGMIRASSKKARSLLIVEDSPTARKAIKELLTGIEVTIFEAEDAGRAIEKLKTVSFDLIIMDLGLENGDGFDLCRYLYENRSTIPIIIYTSRDLEASQEKELLKYARSIIIKTVNSDDRLVNEVKFLLSPQIAVSEEKIINGSRNFPHKKILIVDDDIKNVFVMTSALENLGAEIVDAQNGKEALEMMEKQKFDLVLMDIMMPVMDGYQAMKLIRANEKLKDVPIIAITAKALMDDCNKCIAAGADDYITKPIDHANLMHLVKAWINKNDH